MWGYPTSLISWFINFNVHEEKYRTHFSKYCKSYSPTTRINGFTYIMSEATLRSFPSCSCSEHFRKYQWKSPYVSNDCLWKLCLCIDFLADLLVDMYEIFNINDSSNVEQIWFKQGISFDDSNFNMENYSFLVDVKLFLKWMLDSYWNKLLCKFCITVRRFHAGVQSSTCATFEKCNNGRANSKIGYTTAFIAFEAGRKLNSACCNYVHSQPAQTRFKNVASTLVFTLCQLFCNVIFGKFI